MGASYGFPSPERKPSGHRVYPVSSVTRLRRIAEALGRGHRVAEVVAALDMERSELRRATTRSVSGLPLAEAKQGPLLPKAMLRLMQGRNKSGPCISL